MSNLQISNQNKLLGKWIGDTFGTLRGRVYAECSIHNDKAIFELRLSPTHTGVSTFLGYADELLIQGCVDIRLTLHEYFENKVTNLNVILLLKVINDDLLEGDWQASDGSKGLIQLSRYKHLQQNSSQPVQEPIEVFAKEFHFENLRIYKGDIQEILKIIEQLVLPDGSVIVTVETDGMKKTVFSKTYVEDQNKKQALTSLTITAQKTVNGFNSSLCINLRKNDSSNIFVQSADLLWYYSTPMAVKELLEKRSSKIICFYKRHGLNLNGFIFLAMLVVLPSFGTYSRFLVVAGFIIFGGAHFYIHKYFSQSFISQIEDHPRFFKEKNPTISYLIGIVFSAVIAALATGLIDKLVNNWPSIIGWLGDKL